MYSVKGYWLAPVGFPIRISPDQSLVADSPKLFAGSNVLHRLQLPRHPPYALIRLTIYRNNRPATQPQIHLIGATSDQASQHLTPDIRLTRNYVCTSHILRRSQKHHTSAIIRYHTSTLLKNSPGVKPRLEQPVDCSSLRSARTTPLRTITTTTVVELSGIEPLTSCVQGRRSPS
jgi:hypothetical protein